MTGAPLLAMDGVVVEFETAEGTLRALDGCSLSIGEGEAVGLVGESGSGKTVTALTLLGLLPAAARVPAGAVRFDGRDLLGLAEADVRRIRGRRIAMVFQEPMRSLNPVLRVGAQVTEVLRVHARAGGSDLRARGVELLRRVGLDDPSLFDAYPHQLSGGMRQRVLIAAALAGDPALLVADEPTSALDVTVQAGIVSLLAGLQRDRGLAVLFISHNLALVAETCSRTAVLLGGRVVEEAGSVDLLERPGHPYTRALVACLPRAGEGRAAGAPRTGVGSRPDRAGRSVAGCPFAERCPEALERCRRERPPWTRAASGRGLACWRAGEDTRRREQ